LNEHVNVPALIRHFLGKQNSIYITRVWTPVLVPPTRNTTGYWLLSLLMSQLCSITAHSSVSLKSHLQKTGRGENYIIIHLSYIHCSHQKGFSSIKRLASKSDRTPSIICSLYNVKRRVVTINFLHTHDVPPPPFPK